MIWTIHEHWSLLHKLKVVIEKVLDIFVRSLADRASFAHSIIETFDIIFSIKSIFIEKVF
jgi:hypothetical protein